MNWKELTKTFMMISNYCDGKHDMKKVMMPKNTERVVLVHSWFHQGIYKVLYSMVSPNYLEDFM